MKNRSLSALFLLSVLSLSGCGGAKETPTVTSAPAVESATSAPSVGSKTVDSTTAATIQGKILFEGAAPEPKQISVKGNPECAVLHPGGTIASEELIVNNGMLQNVFVYVKQGLEDYTFTSPTEPVVIQNKTCMYVPHVSGVMVGQPVNFLNQDSTLHNIHAYPKISKAFNLGLPLVGMKQTKKFDAPEVMVPLKCDVHPWMQGYIGVVSNPYFAVSDANGEFTLKNLPPGDYTLEAWHEKLGAQTLVIRIEPQETKHIAFKYSAAA